MRIRIIKYGGNSLRTKELRQAIYKQLSRAAKTSKLIVVCSAIGRDGDQYATDTLLSYANALTSKEKDLLSSVGETVSTHIMTNEGRLKGLNCAAISNSELGIITDSDFGHSAIIKYEISSLLAKLCENKILFVPGFQGHDINFNITTLGRGGSDLTAVTVAKMLNVDEVELIKDVQGVLSGDPHDFSLPILLESLSYDQLLCMTSLGNQVVQNRAVEYAKSNNIKLIVKNSIYSRNKTIVSDVRCCRKFYSISIFEKKIYLLGKNDSSSINEIINFLNPIKPKSIRPFEKGICINIQDELISGIANQLHTEFITASKEKNNDILEGQQ